MNYCEFAAALLPDSDDPNRRYHDCRYGFPVADDNRLFERLVWEINQAGLSWTTILRKEEAFYRAYAGFDIEAVAAFDENDSVRLMADAGIVRNRLKIGAAIANAQEIRRLQAAFGSFKNWLDTCLPDTHLEQVRLFKKHFKFTGPLIVREFLMSTGYMPGAHVPSCPVFALLQQRLSTGSDS